MRFAIITGSLFSLALTTNALAETSPEKNIADAAATLTVANFCPEQMKSFTALDWNDVENLLKKQVENYEGDREELKNTIGMTLFATAMSTGLDFKDKGTEKATEFCNSNSTVLERAARFAESWYTENQ